MTTYCRKSCSSCLQNPYLGSNKFARVGTLLISAPSFSHLHTLHHYHCCQPQTFLLLSSQWTQSPKYFIYHPKIKKTVPFRIKSFLFAYQEVQQSCNGLFLIKCWNNYKHHYYFIHNPTTMQSRKLLRTKNEDRFHLVFDPSKSPYYKVFCFKTEGEVLWFEVYDSQTHKWEKGSKICHRPFVDVHRRKGVYWKGALYFVCYFFGTIYCFDLAELDFYRIDPPESLNPRGSPSYHLFESNGSTLCGAIWPRPTKIFLSGLREEER